MGIPPIRELVDSLCRNGADMLRQQYIYLLFFQTNAKQKDVGMGLCMIMSCSSPLWHGTISTPQFT